MGIQDISGFRNWLDCMSEVPGFDQWMNYLDEKTFLLGSQYYEAKTIDEQLTILGLTEEARIDIRARIKEDEEMFSFPIDPSLRYIRAYANEK